MVIYTDTLQTLVGTQVHVCPFAQIFVYTEQPTLINNTLTGGVLAELVGSGCDPAVQPIYADKHGVFEIPAHESGSYWLASSCPLGDCENWSIGEINIPQPTTETAPCEHFLSHYY